MKTDESNNSRSSASIPSSLSFDVLQIQQQPEPVLEQPTPESQPTPAKPIPAVQPTPAVQPEQYAYFIITQEVFYYSSIYPIYEKDENSTEAELNGPKHLLYFTKCKL